jgi:chromosome segregation ATPase
VSLGVSTDTRAQVVVEDEVVGSQLLDRGKLQKRVTMIPLNKIQAFRANAEVRTSSFSKRDGL